MKRATIAAGVLAAVLAPSRPRRRLPGGGTGGRPRRSARARERSGDRGGAGLDGDVGDAGSGSGGRRGAEDRRGAAGLPLWPHHHHRRRHGTRGGCAGGATRRRSGATTSTASRRRIPGPPSCRPSACPWSAIRSSSSGWSSPSASVRPGSAGRSWRASARSRASRRVGGDVRVTLKSGTVFDLDRFEASDFDDGVRVWDARGGVVDLDSLQIRSHRAPPRPRVTGIPAAPHRLHGTVRTRQGDFTGFLQWDREECLGSDELDGRDAGGKRSLRFDTLRSIARRSADELPGDAPRRPRDRALGQQRGRRGPPRDLRRRPALRPGARLLGGLRTRRLQPPGSPRDRAPPTATSRRGTRSPGSVTTRDGRRLAGRLVFDLDESETTETLDAPSQGVDYTLPFGRIASIAALGSPERSSARSLPPSDSAERAAASVAVTLQSGEELRARARRRSRVGECRPAGLRRRRRAPRVRALERRRAGRLRPPAGSRSGVGGL